MSGHLAIAMATILTIASVVIGGRVAEAGSVDTALVIAVDASQSVDETRYRVQMEGIATALEDQAVIDTILGGPQGAILLSLVVWADRSIVALKWTRIASQEDARAVASKVRSMPRHGGEFTCLARMLRNLSESLLVELPARPNRIVVDVSGDGVDNCGAEGDVAAARQALVSSGITVNGLPVITDIDQIVGAGAYRAPGNAMELLPTPDNGEALTLDLWYRRNVVGGFGSFMMPAYGYDDFGRAMRQKFVIEISQFKKSTAIN